MWNLIRSVIYVGWWIFLVYVLFKEPFLGFALIMVTLGVEWFLKLMKAPMKIRFTTKKKK